MCATIIVITAPLEIVWSSTLQCFTQFAHCKAHHQSCNER